MAVHVEESNKDIAKQILSLAWPALFAYLIQVRVPSSPSFHSSPDGNDNGTQGSINAVNIAFIGHLDAERWVLVDFHCWNVLVLGCIVHADIRKSSCSFGSELPLV